MACSRARRRRRHPRAGQLSPKHGNKRHETARCCSTSCSDCCSGYILCRCAQPRAVTWLVHHSRQHPPLLPCASPHQMKCLFTTFDAGSNLFSFGIGKCCTVSLAAVHATTDARRQALLWPSSAWAEGAWQQLRRVALPSSHLAPPLTLPASFVSYNAAPLARDFLFLVLALASVAYSGCGAGLWRFCADARPILRCELLLRVLPPLCLGFSCVSLTRGAGSMVTYHLSRAR